jgi:hypothetical protein
MTTPDDEREASARVNLLLADIALRQEQLRQLKSYEPKRFLLTAITTITLMAAIIGGGLLVVLHFLGR